MEQTGELLSILCGRLGLLDVDAEVFRDLSPGVLVVLFRRDREECSFRQI